MGYHHKMTRSTYHFHTHILQYLTLCYYWSRSTNYLGLDAEILAFRYTRLRWKNVPLYYEHLYLWGEILDDSIVLHVKFVAKILLGDWFQWGSRKQSITNFDHRHKSHQTALGMTFNWVSVPSATPHFRLRWFKGTRERYWMAVNMSGGARACE